MNDRQMEFRVGAVILATLSILAILVVSSGETSFFSHDQYTLTIRFDEAPGVTVGTPVRKSGILIGRVAEVELTDNGVEVTTRIDRNRRLTDREICRISTNNILGGDATLEFVPSNKPSTGDFLQDGDWLNGYLARDPLQALTAVEDLMQTVVNLEGQVRHSLLSIQGAGDEVGSVARSMNSLVQNNQEQFQRIMSKTETAMNRLDYAMGAFDGLLGDEETRIKMQSTIAQLPEVLGEAQEMMSAFRSVATRAEKNLANFEALTAPLAENGDAVFEVLASTFAKIGDGLGALENIDLSSLGQGLDNLDELMAQLTQFSKTLNNPNSTVGKLVNDGNLYDNLNNTVSNIGTTATSIRNTARNIESLSRQIEPVVRDARTAMDKVARNPYRLGLQGALYRQQSGIKR